MADLLIRGVPPDDLDLIRSAAAAERRCTPLLTADARIARSGAPITCQVITVEAAGG